MSTDEPAPKPKAPALGGVGSICGAKRKDGGICTQPAMANGRCKMHNGGAKRGVSHHRFKNGRSSKALEALSAEIEDRVNDPALVDPRRSVAVQEGAVAELRMLANAGDGPDFREHVRVRLKEALEALEDSEQEGKRRLYALQRYVQSGVEETRALTGVVTAAEKWNQSQNRYWQLALSAGRAISVDEFMTLLFRMADIMEREFGADVARRTLECTDREVCGGRLGLVKREAAEAPGDSAGPG